MRAIFSKYRFAFLGLMLVVPALPLIFSLSAMEVEGDPTQMNDLRSDSAMENSGLILSDLVGTETPDSPRNKWHDSNTIEAFVDSELAKGKKPNRLIHEKSPYLLQHSFNPVDWYPWGEEAFRKARAEDKPIFLSIGYSTCHWCHVMAHESFDSTRIASILNQYFVSIKDGGNAPVDPQGEFAGRNILYVARSLDETASHFGKSPTEIERLLSIARQKLFQVRARRPRPHLDDKVITSWNGLMITALARGYQVLNEPRYLRAAEQSAGFITNKLYDSKEKVLLRRHRKGSAGLEAHLDDYAFLVQGLLDLYEASFSIKWLIRATELTEKQFELFGDSRGGGFYETSGDDRTVLLRLKEDYEGAKPTGNSVAALNLLRLAQMTDNEKWHQKGVETIVTFAGLLNKYPTTMPHMLVALDFQLHNLKQVIIAGKPNAKDTMKMLKRLYDRFLPNKVILLADGGEGQKYLSKYLPFITSMRMRDGIATAYVCENYTCQLPTTDV
jgi:uncharacterized protein YyaL (SSP411 family)